MTLPSITNSSLTESDRWPENNGCSSEVQYLTTMCEALGSSPAQQNKNDKQNKKQPNKKTIKNLCSYSIPPMVQIMFNQFPFSGIARNDSTIRIKMISCNFWNSNQHWVLIFFLIENYLYIHWPFAFINLKGIQVIIN
jgi:hypothetical protein